MQRKEAEKLLEWAHEQNPGPWTAHCRVTGRAAEAIAQKCGLDSERAYISGLLHDIGYHTYRDGKGEKDHIFAGYDFMMNKGCDNLAKICLSHSFTLRDINAFASSYIKCSDEEMAFITKFLAETVYDDYDKLIQLCDSLGMAHGIVLIEKRLIDVVSRHGFRESTIEKWNSIFAVKDYFDKLCNTNIYNLFRDEITADIFTS
jgi:hypothetical protein